MKKFMIAMCLIVSLTALSTYSFADGKTATCTQISEVAMQIMRNRQADVPLDDMLHALNTSGMAGEAKAAMREFIFVIYGSPIFDSKESQQKAVSDVGTAMYRLCTESQ